MLGNANQNTNEKSYISFIILNFCDCNQIIGKTIFHDKVPLLSSTVVLLKSAVDLFAIDFSPKHESEYIQDWWVRV